MCVLLLGVAEGETRRGSERGGARWAREGGEKRVEVEVGVSVTSDRG